MLVFPLGTLRAMRFEGRLFDKSNRAAQAVLEKKAIVSRVWTAPTYAMCVSLDKERTFEINLKATVPTPAGVSAGGGISTTFSITDSADYCQLGPPISTAHEGKTKYYRECVQNLSLHSSHSLMKHYSVSLTPRELGYIYLER